MKRQLVSAVAALCLLGATDAAAQSFRMNDIANDTDAGITVGYMNSGFRNKEWVTESVSKGNIMNGLYLELTNDFRILKSDFYLQTGFTYSYLNDVENFSDSGITLMSKHEDHYLDIPIRIKFAINLNSNLKAFIYAGPSLDFGLSSSMKYLAKISDKAAKFTYDYYTGKVRSENFDGLKVELPAGPFRRFDVFMGTAIGVEFFDLGEIKFGFDWGLLNKNKDENVAEFLTTHRNLVHFGVGVRF